MRLLILLLIAGIVSYSAKSWLGPYHGLEPITVPGGARYEVLKWPDDCHVLPGHCVSRFVFVTAAADTASIKREAEGLLPWVQTQGMGDGLKAVILVGVQPGFARLRKPRFAAGMVFAWRDGRWIYGGAQILPPDFGMAGQ